MLLHPLAGALAASFISATALAGPQQIWQTTIAGTGTNDDLPTPRRLTIDNAGNSYVVGYIDNGGTTGVDASITKIDVNGVIQWTTSYDLGGTGVGAEGFTDVVVDLTGSDIYAVGYAGTDLLKTVVVRLNSSGQFSIFWPDLGDGVGVRVFRNGLAPFSPNARLLLEQPSGEIIVSCATTKQLFLVRFDAFGNRSTAWLGSNGDPAGVRSYTSPGESTSAIGTQALIAKDNAGNYILCGSTNQGTTGEDYTVIKYNSSGVRQWVATYSVNTTTNTEDYPFAITTDLSNNIYVTGNSDNTAGTGMMATVKLSPAGARTWARRGAGPGNGGGIAVDAVDNVYVCGYDHGTTNIPGMVIWKYNSAGTLSSTWPTTGFGAGIRRYGTTTSDTAVDLKLASAGSNLYVTGYTNSGLNGIFTTLKFTTSNGTQVWVETPNVATNSNGYGVAVGPNGHVVSAGWTQNAGQPKHQLAIRYVP